VPTPRQSLMAEERPAAGFGKGHAGVSPVVTALPVGPCPTTVALCFHHPIQRISTAPCAEERRPGKPLVAYCFQFVAAPVSDSPDESALPLAAFDLPPPLFAANAAWHRPAYASEEEEVEVVALARAQSLAHRVQESWKTEGAALSVGFDPLLSRGTGVREAWREENRWQWPSTRCGESHETVE
jgi:hypothetical protein